LTQGNFFSRIAARLQAHPLSLAGTAGLTHNVLSTIGAFEERARTPGSRLYQWDIAGIAAMLLGNSLYMISSKATDGRAQARSLVSDVYGLAAEILAKQPAAVREAAVETTAEFLAQRTEIKDTHEVIVKRLHAAIDSLSHNPWFDKENLVKNATHVGRVKAAQLDAAQAATYQI
jgi:hypothetical protein